MKPREVIYLLIGISIVVSCVVFALSSDGNPMALAQISTLPTSTYTPTPPTNMPTNTPAPPTNTPAPPTNTPAPPTNTPAPPTPDDTEPPVSWVGPLSPARVSSSFKVHWTGYDLGTSGIKCYDVQYKDGADAWQDWQTCTTSTSARFHGEQGHGYFFRARAMDNAGNVEAWPPNHDTRTYVLRKVH